MNERIKNLYEGKSIDRVPFFSNGTIYSGIMAGIKSRDFYLNQKLSYEVQKQTLALFHCDSQPSFDFPGYIGSVFKGEITFVDDPYIGIPKLRPFVKKQEDIDKIILPDLRKDPMILQKFEFLEFLDVNDLTIPISMGSPLEVAGNICEASLLLRLFRKNTQKLEQILRIATDFIKTLGDLTIERFGAKKCSAVLNTPLESLISFKQLEKQVLPFVYEIYQHFEKKGVSNYSFHLCGGQNDKLEYYKEMNFPSKTFVSLDEKIDFQRASTLFGEDYILGGNISTEILVSGSSKEVYNASKNLILHQKHRKGGFVLMPSCTLPPLTPPLNVFAMYKACEDHGKY